MNNPDPIKNNVDGTIAPRVVAVHTQSVGHLEGGGNNTFTGSSVEKLPDGTAKSCSRPLAEILEEAYRMIEM